MIGEPVTLNEIMNSGNDMKPQKINAYATINMVDGRSIEMVDKSEMILSWDKNQRLEEENEMLRERMKRLQEIVRNLHDIVRTLNVVAGDKND